MDPRFGYRFHPSNEEIIDFLNKKMHDNNANFPLIKEVDICKFEPSQLPKLSPPVNQNDEEWFFFNPISNKYANANKKKMERTTNTGSWKVTGDDHEIRSEKTNQIIGIKKILVYHHKNGSKLTKTPWVIHEFHSNKTPPSNQKAFVLCRLKKKSDN